MKKIFEGFTEENTPDLKYYAFDWDDNIMYMPTKIMLKVCGENNIEEIGMGTHDFAEYRTLIGKEIFEYKGTKICGLADKPFRYFESSEESNRQFLLDTLIGKTGPAWVDFVEAINGGSIFAIITARGHNPDTIKEGIRQLIDGDMHGISKKELVKNLRKYREYINGELIEDMSDESLINEYMNLNMYFPVTYGEGSATSPEEGKVIAMRKFISYVREQAKQLQKDIELVDDVSNRFIPKIGFSDDDERNLQAMSDKLSDEEEDSLQMYSTKTGEKKQFNINK